MHGALCGVRAMYIMWESFLASTCAARSAAPTVRQRQIESDKTALEALLVELGVSRATYAYNQGTRTYIQDAYIQLRLSIHIHMESHVDTSNNDKHLPPANACAHNQSSKPLRLDYEMRA